jgi:hypothetical protein
MVTLLDHVQQGILLEHRLLMRNMVSIRTMLPQFTETIYRLCRRHMRLLAINQTKL